MATKARSPNYPQISLPKAIELAAKLYAEAHTHKATAAVVVSTWGYTGLNGKSLGVISALKKYGLLESVGDNEFKISKDGLTMVVDPKSSTERAAAIIRAAFRPALFAELRNEYGDKPPKSDEFMRAFLLKRGFVQSVVDIPIRTYRETIALVEQAQEVMRSAGVEDASDGDAAPSDEDDVMSSAIAEAPPPGKIAPIGPAPVVVAPASADYLDDVYKLGDGRAFILRWPASLTQDEFDEFSDWIALLQRKMKRSIRAAEPPLQ